MSFSISNTKIEEMLRSSLMESPSSSDAGNQTMWNRSSVGGVVYSAPILVTADTKEHLMSHRSRLRGLGFRSLAETNWTPNCAKCEGRTPEE